MLQDFAVALVTTIASLIWSMDCTSEKRLISTLMENYKQNGIEGRPIVDTQRALSVSIQFSLLQILKFDQHNQIITLAGWIQLEWNDVLLSWNDTEYDNIRQVVLHPSNIWTPDVVLVNAITTPQLIHDTKLLVIHVGRIVWVSHVQYQVSCPTLLPPSPAPRGERVSAPSTPEPAECELRFGSWTLNTDLLRLAGLTPRLDTTQYVRHNDWDLIRTRVRNYELEYPWSARDKFSYVSYRVTLKRSVWGGSDGGTGGGVGLGPGNEYSTATGRGRMDRNHRRASSADGGALRGSLTAILTACLLTCWTFLDIFHAVTCKRC